MANNIYLSTHASPIPTTDSALYVRRTLTFTGHVLTSELRLITLLTAPGKGSIPAGMNAHASHLLSQSPYGPKEVYSRGVADTFNHISTCLLHLHVTTNTHVGIQYGFQQNQFIEI